MTTNADGSETYVSSTEKSNGSVTSTTTKVAENGTVKIVLKSETVTSETKTVFTQSKKGSNVSVKSLDTDKTAAKVPATVKGSDGKTYKVTEVATGAMKGNTEVKKLTVGKNITKIGKNAFKGAKNLKTISLKGNVKSIGKGAFSGISKNAVITISGTKSEVAKIKKLLKKSGISDSVKIVAK